MRRKYTIFPIETQTKEDDEIGDDEIVRILWWDLKTGEIYGKMVGEKRVGGMLSWEKIKTK